MSEANQATKKTDDEIIEEILKTEKEMMDLIKVSVEKGEDLKLLNYNGMNMKEYAMINDFEFVYGLICRNGKEPLDGPEMEKIIKDTLSKDQDINTLIFDGDEDECALTNAVKKGDLTVISLLVRNGAYLDPTSKRCKSPLMRACIVGSFTVVQYLVEMGADVNWADSMGYNALDFAQALRRREIVSYLIDKGAIEGNHLCHPWMSRWDYAELLKGNEPKQRQKRGEPVKWFDVYNVRL